MGILGVVVKLDEVLGTHLTMALELLQMSQSLLEACPCLLACGLVVKDHLELMFP
jgi:hypothetical protein